MISKYLKEYFKRKKISQQDIAKVLNLNQTKVSFMLNNKRKITAEELLVLSKEFNINLNKLKDIK